MRDDQPNGLLNLDDLMGGAVTERFNSTFQQVLENILDPNTRSDKARKITLTINILPTKQRDAATFDVETKFNPVPQEKVSTTLLIGADADGVIQASEVSRQIPGQMDIEGHENNPKVKPIGGLRAAQGGNRND